MGKRLMSPLAWVLTLSGVFFVLFLAVSGFFFLSESAREKGSMTSSFFGEGYVGIAEISGPILDSKKTLLKLKRLEEDDRVKAVVLRLNSPGGGTAPSEEIYQAVKQFGKPIIASMASVAASGAYYIACGASKIFANAGTLTGSIGVVMEFADLEKLYDWAKIHRYSVKAGKFKDIGAEYRAMTPEEQKLLQQSVDDELIVFKQVVMTNRNLTQTQIDQIADGRVFTGGQALKVHLIDEIGTITDAVREAGKLGGIKGKPQVLYTEKKKSGWLDYLLDDSVDGSSSESLFRKGSGLAKVLDLFLGQISEVSSKTTEFVPGLYLIWKGKF